MKKLFMVKHKKLEVYFDNKPEAKQMRDSFIKQGFKAHVSIGPDHRRYKK